jgi:hypothetical protein
VAGRTPLTPRVPGTTKADPRNGPPGFPPGRAGTRGQRPHPGAGRTRTGSEQSPRPTTSVPCPTSVARWWVEYAMPVIRSLTPTWPSPPPRGRVHRYRWSQGLIGEAARMRYNEGRRNLASDPKSSQTPAGPPMLVRSRGSRPLASRFPCLVVDFVLLLAEVLLRLGHLHVTVLL